MDDLLLWHDSGSCEPADAIWLSADWGPSLAIEDRLSEVAQSTEEQESVDDTCVSWLVVSTEL